MLTYELKKQPGIPLYEALYRCIRQDILSGKLSSGEKLPSKRSLSEHLEVSKITVEAAYDQLLAEGFIRSKEKVGYFVEEIQRPVPAPAVVQAEPLPQVLDPESERFPFSVWSRLQREVVLDFGEKLLLPMPNTGIPELRQAIAGHLASFRGMIVDPEDILVGAGTDFLYNILIQLLGREKRYGLEDPGYGKIRNIYRAGGVRCVHIPMDTRGVIPRELEGVDVLHISPSHHFPTGLITPMDRRQELLQWARDGERWIIEDDYDSEFRFDARPVSAMRSLDPERVIYMNSFSKSLSPSLRIGYLILPKGLMERFRRELGFYSCTVASFEQHTLAYFLSRGYFEKHINRVRRSSRSRRDRLIALVRKHPLGEKVAIQEEHAGLHFLLKLRTDLPDRVLTEALKNEGIRFPALGSFYHEKREDMHILVVSYSGLREETMEKALDVLYRTIAGAVR